MLEGLKQRLRRSQTDQEGKLKQLTKEVESLQHRSNQLYEAVEKGLLPMDETLTAYSDPSRPLIPTQVGHPFRRNAATDSEVNPATHSSSLGIGGRHPLE